MPNRIKLFMALFILIGPRSVFGQQPSRGHLFIAGGAIRGDNDRLFRAFIDLAGGKDRARIAIVPTASRSLVYSRRVVEILTELGIPAAKVAILDITSANAASQVSNPAILEQIRNCTAVFFAGGDQNRLTRAFIAADGNDTP